ncbi:MAG TPA: glycosyltransferase family 4 protein [Anaerolineales bacterium]|nr:glycosyltransferase family 4 protein [Anaerolineales bacterium]
MSIRICLTPRVHGVGGMVSFFYKLTAGLDARGIQTTHDLHGSTYDSVLVIGGTRDLIGLSQAKRRGIPIVQRLNGMNWLHRRIKTGLRHYLRAEYGNWLLNLIRTRLATHIVYQSEFTRGWWERVYGKTPVASTVIYNGVDLNAYTPDGAHARPTDRFRLLLVEGSLQGGYEMGLETAIELAQSLIPNTQYPFELMIVGKVSPEIKAAWVTKAGFPIHWAGLIAREQIPEIDRSAHLLYSADINAACPNSVIEALACGLPVIAFDTGALPELVSPRAGRVVPYSGDPWQLEPPDVGALAKGAMEIIQAGEEMRQAARQRAEELFRLETMVERYLGVLAA